MQRLKKKTKPCVEYNSPTGIKQGKEGKESKERIVKSIVFFLMVGYGGRGGVRENVGLAGLSISATSNREINIVINLVMLISSTISVQL